ncbi:STAS/SEC14 domain-containing protein [Mucilaginibacter sp. SMC90]|uniref:STAS/SEC14 domain-containing protein n=1 Tax=Mucilaginibacter sp. SMC90 TaxID=2929803 RepID=UPI001FB310B8|nr:STAS/SEC14 domain-containing protein [Mucilaginibacter sp. SMC90]UOE50964.1 STAS/SEC14 domain-containing protein [Mucilaginibacter sp. SMC90]
MISLINDLPAHVLGVRASGEVTKNDMKTVLLPALDEVAGRTGQLNYLLVLDTDVQNFTAAAWWQDMIAGLKHFTDWNRIAVVTDQKAVEIFTDLFELGVPGKSKGFLPDQLAQAKTWVSETCKTSTIKKVARIALGANLVIAGISHLTFARKTFRAQVPDWVPLSKDDTVIYSGLAEIALGSALIISPKAGKMAAGFFAAVFPGNISQYAHHRSAFGLDTDKKRLARLFFQPVLIAWALASTSTSKKS